MTIPRVVSREAWLEPRLELLAMEKAALRELDAVSRQRRDLPWVSVEESYRFDTAAGARTLSDLFEGRSQLIIYHFMLGPGWTEGCPSCSFLSDHFDGVNRHLAHHDVTLIAVSRAPLAELLAFKRRMGWGFEWVSSAHNDFSDDFHASFAPDQIASGTAVYNYRATGNVGEDMHGLSVFTKTEEGRVFHTYSAYSRGVDLLIGTHNFLDLTPKGRAEHGTMDWVRLHDRYAMGEATAQ